MICPQCNRELKYNKSTFEQYQPSIYWCNHCKEEKEYNYVRGYNECFNKLKDL